MLIDSYGLLRKTIQNRLFEVGKLSGTSDFSNVQSVETFAEQFDGLTLFLVHHGQHEDEFIHPLLTEYGVEELDQVEAQCRTFNQEFDALKATLEKLTSDS